MKTPSFGRTMYFLLFVDEYTQYLHVYFLKQKSVVLSYFLQYKAFVENQIGRKILFLCSDNGGEYTSNNFNQFCVQHGIQHQYTNPYNPAQNGISECKNKTMVESTRRMLYIVELYSFFWTKGLQTACYLQNISCTSTLIKTILFELWTGLKPNLSHLRIFGCQAFY